MISRPKMISWPIYLQQYGQYIGKILATLPTLAQYMGNMWLRRLSRILVTLFLIISCPHSCHIFFFSKCGPHYKHYVGKLWPIFGWGTGATYGPYIAHTLPQNSFFTRGYLWKSSFIHKKIILSKPNHSQNTWNTLKTHSLSINILIFHDAYRSNRSSNTPI